MISNIPRLVTLLFYSGEAVSAKQIIKEFKISQEELGQLVITANKSLDSLGLYIIYSSTKLELATLSQYTKATLAFHNDSTQTLSQSALEVLSIISYNQPISKDEVDDIRGVSSEQSLKNLANLGLIQKSSNTSDLKYTTTTEFLKLAGIKNLKDLVTPNE